MEYHLQGARVLITGGAGVLGGHIAAACLALGARVCVTSRSKEKAFEASEKLREGISDPAEVIGQALDARDEQSLQAVKKELLTRWQGVDCLVNCAGGNHPDEFVAPGASPYDVSAKCVWHSIEKNLYTVLATMEVFGPVLLAQPWSSVLNLGSMSGLTPLPGIAGYSMAKAALHNYTQYLAQMLGMHTGSTAHRVNAIAFGFALGEQNRAMLQEENGNWKPRGGAIAAMHPGGSWGEAGDIVGASLFLLSPTLGAASNGSVLTVDRGFSSMSIPRY